MSTVTTARERPHSRLPLRYAESSKPDFERRMLSELRPGIRILDVGGGRRPALPLALRPEGCEYVGLDLSASEMARAPSGSYTAVCAGDVAKHIDDLEGRFDLIVSWQVLEHVKPLDAAIENVKSYLVPNGRFITQFSGTFSAFGLLNQVIPSSLGPVVLKTLLGRDPETVFPAHYHHCWYGALGRAFAGWSDAEILPRYLGAVYWRFFSPAQRAYLLYENWADRGGRRNLATHYLVDARR